MSGSMRVEDLIQDNLNKIPIKLSEIAEAFSILDSAFRPGRW